jgi:uncharacterized membrane protein YdjX (TVP38/TMEM64 family)
VKHYFIVFGGICVGMLVIFGIAQAAGTVIPEAPEMLHGGRGATPALLIMTLLVADVVIPVPSSLLMIANGVFYGIAAGTAFSVVGATGAVVLGWALGRWCTRPAERFIPTTERMRAQALVERWGVLAVIASRPVPILAEAVAIVAGLAGMRLRELLPAAVLGSLPAALLYAATGAGVARLDNVLLVFSSVLGLAVLTWWIGMRVSGGFGHHRDGSGSLGRAKHGPR